MKVVFVGAGRLATQLAQALRENGHTVDAVYSRTKASAEALTAKVGGVATDKIGELPTVADAFIIAVKDSALREVICRLREGREACPMFHTSGSMPMSVFGSEGCHGVIYPMQTFSKERRVDFSHVPIFIEGNGEHSLQVARRVASAVSSDVRQLSSEQRRQLHLAAVFACNFSNHCYALAAEVLERNGLTFDTMLPLIEETAAKVHTLHPREAQTGPAVRYDENVINAHLQMLGEAPRLQQVYELMSKSIHETYSND